MKEVVKSDECVLRLIETYQESQKYGKNGGWCTAQTKGHWDHYHLRGNIWILSKGRRAKYQIFQNTTNNAHEIKGRGNKTALPFQIVEKYPSVKEFFTKTLELNVEKPVYKEPIFEPGRSSVQVTRDISRSRRNHRLSDIMGLDTMTIMQRVFGVDEHGELRTKIDDVDIFMVHDIMAHGYRLVARRYLPRQFGGEECRHSYNLDAGDIERDHGAGMLRMVLHEMVNGVNSLYDRKMAQAEEAAMIHRRIRPTYLPFEGDSTVPDIF